MKKLDIYAPFAAGATSSVNSERFVESLLNSFISKASGKLLKDEKDYTMTVYQVSDYSDPKYHELDDSVTYDPIRDLRDFHSAFGHPIRVNPTKLDDKELNLRLGLIEEELDELVKAMLDGTPREAVKELADLLYVVYSLSVANGMWPDIEEAFLRVHESNMSKNGPDGKPIYNDKGKILKGPNYQPPNFDDWEEYNDWAT